MTLKQYGNTVKQEHLDNFEREEHGSWYQNIPKSQLLRPGGTVITGTYQNKV